jgi:CheY-like chemotaxis protein
MTVLVVEDEPLILMLAVGIVEDAGFSTVQAKSAHEAVAVLENRSDIRIVFTDIEMPGAMDGVKLAHAIRRRWPPIELLLTSGRHQVRKEDLPARGRFLRKPYSLSQVAEALHQLVA